MPAGTITSSAFASAVQPIAADTLVITDTDGLIAGDIRIGTSNGEIPGYYAAPKDRANLPVVLVVQEIFGLHEHIKDVARRLAKQGYLAVAPALYHRQGDVLSLAAIDEIRAVVAKVPNAQVMSDLDAAMLWAEGHGGDTRRLGITGFCWGGRMVWLYAAHQPALKAAVAWYGRLDEAISPLQGYGPIQVADRLKAPVLGLYGGQDPSIPLEQVDALRARLPKGSRIDVYTDAPHAFYADYRSSYRAAEAADGWRSMLEWFRQHGVYLA